MHPTMSRNKSLDYYVEQNSKNASVTQTTPPIWTEIFGIGRYGASIEMDRKNLLRFQGHTFLNINGGA